MHISTEILCAEQMQAKKVYKLVHLLHQPWIEGEAPETEDELVHNLEANLFMSHQHRAYAANTPMLKVTGTSPRMQHAVWCPAKAFCAHDWHLNGIQNCVSFWLY